jgi:hypothetical protein
MGSARTAGSGGTNTPPRGAIEETVRLVGGPAPGNRPLRREEIEVLDGRRLVARVRTNWHGRFHLAVAPGRYRFRPQGGPDLLPPKAVVTAAHTTTLRLILTAR